MRTILFVLLSAFVLPSFAGLPTNTCSGTKVGACGKLKKADCTSDKYEIDKGVDFGWSCRWVSTGSNSGYCYLNEECKRGSSASASSVKHPSKKNPQFDKKMHKMGVNLRPSI